MSTLVIVGSQWGDEGKGKITDLLSENYDIIARYQGGSNAGHTVVLENDSFIFHLLPSGILHEDKICLIGNGVVLDPEVLFQEIENLHQHNIDITNRLFIDYKTQVILPYHKIIDEAWEKNKENRKIGTTKRGIGPAYVDKFSRIGIRICDLIHLETLPSKLDLLLTEKNDYLLKNFGIKKSKRILEKIKEKYIHFGKLIKPFALDGSLFLDKQIKQNKNILFEGAQGTMLDVDHGTYPYVTSSNTVSGNASVGCGISPTFIDKVIGIAKAYTTRVGEGPFPTELWDTLGDKIREYGYEYGATTGRPRRCGWFDAVVVKYANRINGIKEIALTKLDVLSNFPKIKICKEYQIKDESYYYFPGDSELIPLIKPIYEELDGWQEDISVITDYQKLPEKVKIYIKKIEEYTESKVSIISVGPKRSQTIFR